MDRDPVCGKEIKDTANSEAVVYLYKTYYFCSLLCKIAFLQNIEKYAGKNFINGNKQDHQ